MHLPVADMLKRSYTFFRSARMTVIIITVLLALYVTGLIVPQKSLIPSADAYAQWRADYPAASAVIEFLRLNDIYAAPLTILFLVLFFVNLLVVVGHRVPVILRRMYLLRSPGGAPPAAGAAPPAGASAFTVNGRTDAAGQDIRRFLKRRFWTLVGGDGRRTFLAVRNRYSPAGFLFFHASFLLCLVGGLLVMYTRFAGTLVLTEGQEFTADLGQFRSITRDPKLMKALPPFHLLLEKVTPRYEKGVGTDLDVDLTVTQGGSVERARIKVNQPLERGALSILAESLGVSPLLVLRDAAGKELAGGFFSLNVLDGDEDGFTFPDIPYSFTVTFYPDFVETGGKPGSRSRELNNPVMQVAVRKGDAMVSRGLLPLRQTMAFDGLSLSFEEVRYWIQFQVVREYGTGPLFAGFLSGIIGLVMRLIFYQKTIRIFLEDDPAGMRVSVDGTSEYYPHSFREEREGFARELQGALERGSLSRASSPPPADHP